MPVTGPSAAWRRRRALLRPASLQRRHRVSGTMPFRTAEMGGKRPLATDPQLSAIGMLSLADASHSGMDGGGAAGPQGELVRHALLVADAAPAALGLARS